MLLELPPGDKPTFLRLANSVVAEIERGRLRPGDRLPGSRPLARSLGVHRNTVLAAWRELRSQGWIDARPGGSTHVAALPPRAKKPRAGRTEPSYTVAPAPEVLLGPRWPAHVLQLSGGKPDLRELPVTDIARAWKAAVQHTRGRVLDYGDPRGHPRLRAALADLLAAERGLTVGADDLVVTRGSQQALFLVALALLRRGDRVGVEALGYPPAWSALRTTGAELVPLPLDASGVCTRALDHAAEAGLRAVYLTPHHQFPTLATLPAGRRIEVLAIARRHRLAVIEDDYDHEFHYAGKPVFPLAARDPGAVISLGTLSKTLAPGLRLGWVAGPPVLVDAVSAHRVAVDRQGDAATELAVALLVEDGTIGRHLRRMRRIYASRQEALVSALRAHLGDRIRFEVPAGGLALWVETDLDVDRWVADSLAEGVAFETGARFHLAGGRTRHVRLGFASLRENELQQAVAVLARTARLQAP